MHPMVTEAFFTTIRTLKLSKCVSVDKWIKEITFLLYICMCICTHTHMEYYSTIKKNEIMCLVTPWIDLEDIMLNE